MSEIPNRASVRKRSPPPRFRFVSPEQVTQRRKAPVPDMDPDPICPICAKIILGDLEDINTHIDECVAQPESTSTSGIASVASSTIPQLERPSSLVVNIDEEDVRFGSPQFTEKDIERVLEKQAAANPMLIKFDRRAVEASKHTQLLREILDSPPMGPELQQLQSLLRSFLDQIASAPKCSVCWETLKMPAVTSVNCWHVCCEECWLRQLGTKRLCPQCSTITNPEDLRKVYI
jgi:hypothetical protein